ncbi:hypothetical protein SERLADRAFT_473815 [Serpula lacrymans var. lacrymans S7.9]|uniref:Uncharacterized protein n=1 Tax=Serpula lacrymans var. lacrymans (strain S7.9) TaxID=578457 RepID=F8P4B8_SERL9|nr:uncharacterized protein SERLADRAFT_473815 [Serpula lacrymans var. lacrymans S7.9]XP_007324568.1 uncharacterized protein SERLADRAFT_480614 [Serpula lacrymans var. lacrymans S7.9]EGO18541.1 hypothetical protein SERLADRAFT_480614 [Serpula lacrymans var. lacrymans S7.9]EGO21456.1 hypothetical protein SERLADRAFT_473815 [Serpula lacrymans var. lacrymans S7.9]
MRLSGQWKAAEEGGRVQGWVKVGKWGKRGIHRCDQFLAIQAARSPDPDCLLCDQSVTCGACCFQFRRQVRVIVSQYLRR